MDSLFKKNPWLRTVLIVILIVVSAWGIYRLGYYIWDQNFNTTNRTGEVESVSWQMDVKEYHWEAVNKSSWEEDVPYNAYFVSCYDKERTVNSETVVGQYCSYYIDEWVYYQTLRKTGVDRNPIYPTHPTNTSKVQYREQPGTFIVNFSCVEYVRGQFSFTYDHQTWNEFQPGMKVTVGVNKKGRGPFKPELPR